MNQLRGLKSREEIEIEVERLKRRINELEKMPTQIQATKEEKPLKDILIRSQHYKCSRDITKGVCFPPVEWLNSKSREELRKLEIVEVKNWVGTWFAHFCFVYNDSTKFGVGE